VNTTQKTPLDEICYLLCLQPLFTTHSWKTN